MIIIQTFQTGVNKEKMKKKKESADFTRLRASRRIRLNDEIYTRRFFHWTTYWLPDDIRRSEKCTRDCKTHVKLSHPYFTYFLLVRHYIWKHFFHFCLYTFASCRCITPRRNEGLSSRTAKITPIRKSVKSITTVTTTKITITLYGPARSFWIDTKSIRWLAKALLDR